MQPRFALLLAGALALAAGVAPCQTFVRTFPDLPSVSPRNIAVDPGGNIWVTNEAQGDLVKLSPSGSELLRIPNRFPTNAGTSRNFTVVCNGVAANGNGVYVADSQSVYQFDLGGAFVREFVGAGSAPGQIAAGSRLGGIALSPSGDVYVTDMIGDQVLRYSATGSFLSSFGGSGTADGQFNFTASSYLLWTLNAGIAVGNDGDVYVVDVGNSRVQRFDSSGTWEFTFPVAPFVVTGVAPNSYYTRASIAVDAAGKVHVARHSFPYLARYLADGTLETTYSPSGPPWGLAVGGANRLLVADEGNKAVILLDWTGTTFAVAGRFGNSPSSTDGRLNTADSVFFDSNGNLWVCDNTVKLQRFDTSGNFLGKITPAHHAPSGTTGGTTYQLRYACTDAQGNFYASVFSSGQSGSTTVTEWSVHKWDATGQFVQAFGHMDAAANPSANPPVLPGVGLYGPVQGLAPDGAGGVWISDYLWHRVLHYDAGGSLVATVGGPASGSGPGQFAFPMGLALAANHDVLVVDRNNNRVQRLDAGGNYVSHFPISSGANSSIAISADQSRIYVGGGLAVNGCKVAIHGATGGLLARLGVDGGGPGEVGNAVGLATGSQLVAIADSVNNRISLFDVTLLDQQVPVVTLVSPLATNVYDGVVIPGDSVAISAQVTDTSPTTVTSTPSGPSSLFALLPAGGGSLTGPITSPYTGTSDYGFSASINAIDTSGNSGGVALSIKRDVNAPTNWAASYVDNTVIGTSSVSLFFQVYDYTSKTVTVSHAGGTHFQGGNGYLTRTINVSGLQNGPNAITFTATDAVGHTSTYTRTLIADLSAPIITFVGLGGSSDPDCFGPGQSPLPVTVQVTDYAATSLSSTPSASWGGTLPAGGGTRTASFNLVQGPNTITVRAQDQYGLSSSVSTTVLYDLTAPTVGFDSPTASQLVRGTLHVVVDAEDLFANGTPGCGVDTVALTLDSVACGTLTEAPYELDLDTTGLADGSHTLTATATDGVGNVRTTSVVFVVDNTAPTVTITAPTANAIVGGNDLQFTATASDANGITVVQMLVGTNAPNDTDGSTTFATPVTNAAVASVYDTIPLADGSLLLRVTARDAAGNEATAEVSVIVDNTAPEKALVSPTDGATVTGVVPIVASASDPNLTSLVIKVDGNVVGSTSSSSLTVNFDTVARGEGPMTIEVIVTDAANNTSSCTATVNVVNLTYDFDPDTLSLKNKGQGVVTAHLEGPTVANLLPVAAHRIELRVQGGNSVSALGAGGVGDSDADLVPDLTIRFDRATLINSIKAGVLGNFLPADGMIAIELWIDGHRAGSSPVRIKS